MNPPAMHILVVDDETDFQTVIRSTLENEGYRVTTAGDGAAAINQLQAASFDLALLDVRLPRVDGVEVLRFLRDHFLDTQAVMLTGVNDIRLAVECMQLGAYSYIPKPYSSIELLAVIRRALERKRLLQENRVLKVELSRHAMAETIIGRSKPMLDVLSVASRVAPTDSTVLIQGPSGTGKELVASFIHRNSLRKENPFITINCAAVPETLIESELFGHEKGAFTDAVAQRQGLVEMASTGTLFLDEVGEISIMMQPKLLRFLQTGEFRRVGGNKALNSNVRVVSATNKDLRSEVADGRFREDLLYRLNVITLEVPPLRDRSEDIPQLVEHFLRKRVRSKAVKMIDDKAMELLMRYDWPGNVRELENVIERAGILCREGMIRVEDIALPAGLHPGRREQNGDSILGTAVGMREIEKAHIDGVLKLVSWNKNTAAGILGISLKTLYTKIQQFNLTRD